VTRVLIAGGGTGGHLMPALAIATRLAAVRPDVEPVLVGAIRGIEAQLLPTRPFRYCLLPIEPLYRRQWWKNLRLPLVAAKVYRDLRQLFDREQPAAVLGTGGYASAPSVWYAARRGIPAAIQEQNAFPGLATRLLAGRVGHIYLGMPEGRTRLTPGPETRVFDTGNPVTPPNPARRAGALTRFGLSGGERVLLVTGGSQGAVAINRAVAAWLERGGGSDLTILWATGRGSHSEFARFHRPPSVQVFDFLDPIQDAYAVASMVVGRAGMMTGAELCAWGVPMVLVPLPTSAGDHQRHNAAALGAAGAAVVVEQGPDLSVRLAGTIGTLLGDPGRLIRMAEAARTRGRPDAVDEIVTQFLALFRG
jgi:UDP-N-acetylglucosamine--N-acetylmuramyl-(pentapeptide) pyrophosphoryl-undecaprenol N-acetylglucosamine transferase